jgi:mannitol/fructose-specific phosphotransferase system IIA component (Ntr-type)
MVLVLSPSDPPELHLEVLASIARFFQNRDARVLLRHAKNAEEAMDIIRKYS